MGIGDWGLGIGDWGLGPIPNPQSPIPNPQSPIPNPQFIFSQIKNIIIIEFSMNYYNSLLIKLNKFLFLIYYSPF
jgi:hypothetical protein